MLWLELAHGSSLEAAQTFFVDKFSVIMALINGVVGGGICLYALGYMREYHEVAHREVADRRPLFFALLFIFMGAMFGIIFVNNLVWLFLFWEITTLCSFLLIGYTGTEEARRNALRGAGDEPGRRRGFRAGHCVVLPPEREHRIADADHLEALAGAAARGAALFCGHYEIGATALLQLAAWRHGGPYPGVGAAPLQHDGQGGRLSGAAHGAGHYGDDGRFDGGDGGRGDVPGGLAGSHHHQRRQEGARLVHGGQSRLDCDVRRASEPTRRSGPAYC